MGRFWSPDPGGLKTAHPGNPASWNKYAYVEGDPVNFNDRLGLLRNIVGNCGALLNGNPQDGCDDGGGDYVGSGCTYETLGYEANPDCSEYGDPDLEPSAPFCGNQLAQTFIQANFNAAAATANSMGIGGENGDADILTLSGVESGWGTFKGGYQGAYFGMKGVKGGKSYAGEIVCVGIGTQPKKGAWACEMEFSSLGAAAAAFASREASVVNGASDPIQFFSNLFYGAGYASQTYGNDIQYLQYMLPTWQWVDNCMQTLGLVQ